MASGLAPVPNRSSTVALTLSAFPGVDQHPGTSHLPDEVGVHHAQGEPRHAWRHCLVSCPSLPEQPVLAEIDGDERQPASLDRLYQLLLGGRAVHVDPDAQAPTGLLVPVLLDEVRVDACYFVGVFHQFGVPAPKRALEEHFDGRTATEVYPPAAVCEDAQPSGDSSASHRQRIAASRLAAPKAQ